MRRTAALLRRVAQRWELMVPHAVLVHDKWRSLHGQVMQMLILDRVCAAHDQPVQGPRVVRLDAGKALQLTKRRSVARRLQTSTVREAL
jgi:hypothetical protein